MADPTSLAQAAGELAGDARALSENLNRLAQQLSSVPLPAEHAGTPFVFELTVFALAGSVLVTAARESGLVAVEEVFADRGYRADGSLVPRSQPGALIDDEDAVLTRTLAMIREQRVQAVDGAWVPLNAQTVCLHGDGPHALAFARRIRAALDGAGICVRAVTAESEG